MYFDVTQRLVAIALPGIICFATIEPCIECRSRTGSSMLIIGRKAGGRVKACKYVFAYSEALNDISEGFGS
jgi:hypothetical protein